MVTRGKCSNLGQLKKKKKKKALKISLLSIARRNKLFLQYPIRKLSLLFSIVLELLKKEWNLIE